MHRAAATGGPGKELATMPVGQIVGSMNSIRAARDVIYDMVNEYVETTEKLREYLQQETAR
jgi:hypothetical protein